MDGRFATLLAPCLPCAGRAAGACSGCSEVATLSVDQGTGPDPQLPPPKKTLIPTLNIAPAVHWAAGEAPTPAPGLRVVAFATGSTIRAGCTCCPTATCWWPRPTRPTPGRGKGLRGKIQKSR
jgi:hypothetical protein